MKEVGDRVRERGGGGRVSERGGGEVGLVKEVEGRWGS